MCLAKNTNLYAKMLIVLVEDFYNICHDSTDINSKTR